MTISFNGKECCGAEKDEIINSVLSGFWGMLMGIVVVALICG